MPEIKETEENEQPERPTEPRESIGGIRIDEPTDFRGAGSPRGSGGDPGATGSARLTKGYKKDGTARAAYGSKTGRIPETPSGPADSPRVQSIREPKKAAKDKDAVDGIAGMVLSIHLMASAYFKVEELQLTEEESVKLSKAMVKVAKEYDIETTAKADAWMNLAYAASSIYGTRIYAIVENKREEKKMVKAA